MITIAIEKYYNHRFKNAHFSICISALCSNSLQTHVFMGGRGGGGRRSLQNLLTRGREGAQVKGLGESSRGQRREEKVRQ